jgi:3-dehydroquinate synthase
MKLNTQKCIFFTGFMASGKSRIGAAVAELLHWPFIDTDKYIEEQQGCSVSDIFAEHGESYFRKLEVDAIRTLASEPRQIISLGGGALTNPEVLPIIRQNGVLVRLTAPLEVLSERIGRRSTRPLLANLSDEERLEKIRSMLAEREVYYSQADFAVESTNDLSFRQVAEKVIKKLRFWVQRQIYVEPGESPAYPIFIGNAYLSGTNELLEDLNLNTDYLICTDQNVARLQKKNLNYIRNAAQKCRYFQFVPGESNKNMNNLNRLYSFMLKRGYTRKTTLLQFSGGVVGDMAGFGAATYQRGVPFIQFPTTLLSMVDSSVGGKVAVNHPMGKNMIGAFYQPRAVVIDLDVLKTLPEEEYRSGLAEVIKYGVIYDENFFSYLEEHVEDIRKRNRDTLEYIIRRSCEIKAEVVSIDEKEQGLRAILNYGHTFGHAIEKVTNYSEYTHGLAVSLGMRVAGRLSTQLGLWQRADEERQNRLLDALQMPKQYAIDPEEAWEAMGVDKKADKNSRIYILPTRIGAVEKVRNTPKEDIHLAWMAIH